MRTLFVAAFVALSLTGDGRAQDQFGTQAEAMDEFARTRLEEPKIVNQALSSWLAAAGAALGRQEWNLATSFAERAWMLYLEAASEGGGDVYARQAALAKMALAKSALEQEQYHHAASMYRQSAELYPDPRAYSSAGQIAGRQEDWNAARRDFEAALALPGVEASTHLRLAEVLYALGETERAIERVEEGVQAGANSKEAQGLLTRFRREVAVEENYSKGGTLHFAITFENVDDQRGFLHRVETSLERVYSRVCQELGKYPQNRVPVVVYPSATTYREASGAPTWTAAVYNGKIRVPSGDLAEAPDEHLDRLLAHEFSHYLIERLAGTRAPAWLQEGLAQHVEADGEAPRWIPGFTRRLLRSYRGKPMPFTTKQLEGSFHGSSGSGVQAAYAASYYMIQDILETDGMFRLHRFMEAIKGGADTEDALYQEMYLTYDKLDARWVSYAKGQLNLD